MIRRTELPAGSPHLDGARRGQDLAALTGGESVDVLVIGGGVTGTGVALDAASRGLSVALLERGDLAQGTSRWSSKLVHGGLRYLAQGAFGLAFESARERSLIMRHIAPHLTRPVGMLVPLTARVPRRKGVEVEVGIRIGDAFRIASRTSRRTLPPPRRVSALEAARLAPGLDTDGLRGAILYWDGQLEDDARLVVALARTAAAHGARILTRTAVTGVRPGVVAARDELSGERFELKARHVIGATGVWAGELAPDVKLRPSKGAHLLIPSARLGDPRAAVSVPAERDNTWVFAVPLADGLTLVGLTDDPFPGPPVDAPRVEPEEEHFLLETISTALAADLTPDDVVGRFAGLRPLVDGDEGATADLSRRHAVIEDPDTGLVTITGGKLTTYRRMAEDAVDVVAARPGVRATRCRTKTLPLVGAPGGPVAAGAPAADLPPRLLRRFGTEAPGVAALAAGRPELLRPAVDGHPGLAVELLFGARAELALTPEDLVDRRVRIGLVDALRPAALVAAAPLLSDAEEVPR